MDILMSDLASFAQLIKQANEEKQARLLAAAEEKVNQVAPLLSELFSSVKQAKKEKKENQRKSVSKNAPLLQELQQVLTASKQVKKEISEPNFVQLVPEQPVQEEIQLFDIDEKIDQAVAESDKRFLKLHNRLQTDLQALKRYVDNKPSSVVHSGGTSGSGEVRILRMDDIVRTTTPAAGDTLVWSAVLNKFELKPAGNSGGTTVTSDEEMPYAKRVDFITDNELYKAEAVVGSLETAVVWRIRKVTIAADSDVSETWAGGTSLYDKRWSDRLTYTYI